MKKSLFFLALLFSFCPFPGPDQAAAWTNSPESYVSGWQYQRDIYMDFAVSPETTSPRPIPGAVYDGSEDPGLSSYDHFEVFNSVEWSAGDSGVGIWNPNPWGLDDDYSTFGEVEVSLGNISNIFLEYKISANYTLGLEMIFPNFLIDWEIRSSGVSVVENQSYWIEEVAGSDFHIVNMWAEITPNSADAILIGSMDADSGVQYWMEDLHIAADVMDVPVIPALWLLGSGFIGLAGIIRKFGKR